MAVNVYDQAARYVIKLDPPGFFAWLFGLIKTALVFRGWLDTRTLPFPGEADRTCDTVAALEDPDCPDEPIALVVESQAEPDADMLERMLEYLARFRREYRHGPERRGKYRVAGAVLNLTGPVQQNVLHLVLPGGGGAELRLQILQRTLREEDAATTVAAVAAGQLARCVLPWIPLMRGGAAAGIIEEWKRCAAAEPDNRRLSDYGGLALVFAELSGAHQQWHEALKGWNMRQSQQVLEWQEEARLETLRATLLRLLRLRFKAEVPPDLQTAVHGMSDTGELSQWIDAAATSETLEAFRAAVQV
jgi:hypothetical protein